MRNVDRPVLGLKYLLLLGTFVAALLIDGCGPPSSQETRPHERLVIAGASSMQPLLETLIPQFEAQFPEIAVDLQLSDSSYGLERLLNGEVDLVANTISLGQQRTRLPSAVQQGLTELQSVPIGVDGIGIVVNASSSLDAISIDQLRRLFNGRLLDWMELGLPAGEVVLVSREEGSGTRLAFEQRVMAEEPVSLTAIVMPSDADVGDFVAEHPHAIGYVGGALLASSHAELLKILSVNEVTLSPESVANQRYPLIQPVTLVTVGEPTAVVRKLIDFALSRAGQESVSRYYVPLVDAQPDSGGR